MCIFHKWDSRMGGLTGTVTRTCVKCGKKQYNSKSGGGGWWKDSN